jgi:hypothetical protein
MLPALSIPSSARELRIKADIVGRTVIPARTAQVDKLATTFMYSSFDSLDVILEVDIVWDSEPVRLESRRELSGLFVWETSGLD